MHDHLKTSKGKPEYHCFFLASDRLRWERSANHIHIIYTGLATITVLLESTHGEGCTIKVCFMKQIAERGSTLNPLFASYHIATPTDSSDERAPFFYTDYRPWKKEVLSSTASRKKVDMLTNYDLLLARQRYLVGVVLEKADILEVKRPLSTRSWPRSTVRQSSICDQLIKNAMSPFENLFLPEECGLWSSCKTKKEWWQGCH